MITTTHPARTADRWNLGRLLVGGLLTAAVAADVALGAEVSCKGFASDAWRDTAELTWFGGDGRETPLPDLE